MGGSCYGQASLQSPLQSLTIRLSLEPPKRSLHEQKTPGETKREQQKGQKQEDPNFGTLLRCIATWAWPQGHLLEMDHFRLRCGQRNLSRPREDQDEPEGCSSGLSAALLAALVCPTECRALLRLRQLPASLRYLTALELLWPKKAMKDKLTPIGSAAFQMLLRAFADAGRLRA